MPAIYTERPRKGTESVLTGAICDRCGANAYRPHNDVACYASALKRPDRDGNFPVADWSLVLCHDCADALKQWVDSGPLLMKKFRSLRSAK